MQFRVDTDGMTFIVGGIRGVACQREGTTVLPRAWDHLGAGLSMAVIDWPGQRRHAGPVVGVAGRTVPR